MKQQPKSFKAAIQKNVSLEYLAYLPTGYQTTDKEWPLIVFLHGAGERGRDLEHVKQQGLPKLIEAGNEYPFIVVSPQCPQGTTWPIELDMLHAFVEKMVQEYRVDTSRIYLTGLSMGGYGTWHLAEAYPQMFAAIAPICGGTMPAMGFPQRISVLKDMPVWAFHGAKDDILPLRMTQELVDVLREHEGNVKFTIYPDAVHDSWTQTYENPDLYEWLLQQKNENFQMVRTLV